MAGTGVFAALGLVLGLLPLAAAAQADAAAIEAAVEAALSAQSGSQIAPAGPENRLPPRNPNEGAVTGLPVPRFVSLKSSEGNARRGPGLTHRIDWVFTRAGMPLRITAEYEHWRRVEDSEGQGGWVNYSLLSGLRTVLVIQDMAEFRTKATAAAEVAYQSELGVIGRLLECEPNWCRVSVDGVRGWVEKSALWGVDQAEVLE